MSRRRTGTSQRSPITGSERQRRIRNLIGLGYIRRASDVPDESIPADTVIPANGHYSLPIPFYAEEVYRCRDCGKQVTWTAAEKFQYYEVEKGNVYARRVRCDDCHAKSSA